MHMPARPHLHSTRRQSFQPFQPRAFLPFSLSVRVPDAFQSGRLRRSEDHRHPRPDAAASGGGPVARSASASRSGRFGSTRPSPSTKSEAAASAAALPAHPVAADLGEALVDQRIAEAVDRPFLLARGLAPSDVDRVQLGRLDPALGVRLGAQPQEARQRVALVAIVGRRLASRARARRSDARDNRPGPRPGARTRRAARPP
jgi:hypothetical protein